ncbi:unnamed protein product [Pleuronectes platessa]|uniref:Uncharacterized protein n=1 Tax=Pleuronectes platessa TaxID=8262 RepID=A0A9N7VHQ1_PLEPL|nr:unnamed protein product [Pleuronectes platessa]
MNLPLSTFSRASANKTESAEVKRPADGGADTRRKGCRCQRRRHQMSSSLHDISNPPVYNAQQENTSRTCEQRRGDIQSDARGDAGLNENQSASTSAILSVGERRWAFPVTLSSLAADQLQSFHLFFFLSSSSPLLSLSSSSPLLVNQMPAPEEEASLTAAWAPVAALNGKLKRF